jgi:methionyl aminopeptidase
MIIRKTPEQVDKMAAAGEILVRCLQMLEAKARPGVRTKELDLAAEKLIRSQGAEPASRATAASRLDLRLAQLDGRARDSGHYGTARRRAGVDVGVIKDGWVADAA